MKNKIYFLSFAFVLSALVSSMVWAQSTPIYNSSTSSYSAGGPLNLQQILQGNKNAATGEQNQYYGEYYGGQNFRPYGTSGVNAGYGFSPQEIARARAERAANAQQRERENLAALQRYDDELAAYQREQAQNNGQTYGQQPASYNNVGAGATGSGRRVYNQKDRERLEKPAKVFNSLR